MISKKVTPQNWRCEHQVRECVRKYYTPLGKLQIPSSKFQKNFKLQRSKSSGGEPHVDNIGDMTRFALEIDWAREFEIPFWLARQRRYSIRGGGGDQYGAGASAAGFSDELDGAACGECSDGEAGWSGCFVFGRFHHGRLALGRGRPAHLGEDVRAASCGEFWDWLRSHPECFVAGGEWGTGWDQSESGRAADRHEQFGQ